MKSLLSSLICCLALVLFAGAAFADTWGFAVNSRGNFDEDERIDALWRVNLDTGETEYVGHTGFGFFGIDGIGMDDQGDLFGADDATKTLLRISRDSGAAAPSGNSRSNMKLPLNMPLDFGFTFTCDGDLLISSAANGTLYRGNVETGEVELIGDLVEPIADMATIGDKVYGIGRGSDAEGRQIAPDLYVIDIETPSAERIGMLGDEVAPYNQAGLAADEAGNLYAIANRRNLSRDGHPFREGEILRIDPDTGRAEKLADTLVGFESLAIAPPTSCDFVRGGTDSPPAVPVLSPAGLLALMLLLAGIAARRFI